MILRHDIFMIREISTLCFSLLQQCFFATVAVFRMNPKISTFIMTQNHDFDV